MKILKEAVYETLGEIMVCDRDGVIIYNATKSKPRDTWDNVVNPELRYEIRLAATSNLNTQVEFKAATYTLEPFESEDGNVYVLVKKVPIIFNKRRILC